MLDEHYPEAVMAVGIHDADYFSRIPSNLALPDGWTILPHSDGTTKDLWVATGEISTLFGSETIPSRDLLTACGVQIDKIARDYPGGRTALIETATEAWGWRGLVYEDSANEVSCCMPLSDALPHLIDLLSWGFDHTVDSLAEPAAAQLAKNEAGHLLNGMRSYAESHPDATVTEAFLHLLPGLYGRLLGYNPSNLEMTRITEVFKFNESTASLPRFRVLGAFLDPATRAICQDAYNASVEGADINRLDKFCPGAIPFDLVVPGKGRGTICLLEDSVTIDLDEPVLIPVSSPPATAEELASIIMSQFGPDAALVGKAVTLVLMMTSEYIFVLNEEGSSYVPLCEKMAGLMREKGVEFDFYPILRIGYRTWDSLSACDAVFSLPGHLASVFRKGDITSLEFADSWQSAVRDASARLDRLARLTGTEELLFMLTEDQTDLWIERLAAYRNANAELRAFSERTEPMKIESVRLRDLSYQIKQDVQSMEAQKGDHFRREVKPRRDALYDIEAAGQADSQEAERLRGEIEEHEKHRAELESRIALMRDDAQRAHNRSLEMKNAVQSLEKGEEVKECRLTIKSIEYEAELARLWLVRDALLVSKGLTFSNHRPSAWWFILADPELRWFSKVIETAQFRWEEIS